MTQEELKETINKALEYADEECIFISMEHKDLVKALLNCLYRAL